MTKCKLVQANGRSRGIAFIEYESASSARKAIDAENGANHMGRDITVDYSGQKPQASNDRDNGADEETNTLFVGNISFNTSENSVRDFFAKCG
jgi:nucleolin